MVWIGFFFLKRLVIGVSREMRDEVLVLYCEFLELLRFIN